MKKFLIFVLAVFCCPAVSHAWGLLGHFVSSQGRTNPHENFMLYTVLHGNAPLRTCVSTDLFNRPEEYNPINDFLFAQAQLGLNRWLERTREVIGQSGRSAEFKDVLDVLPASVVLERVADTNNSCAPKLDFYVHGSDTNVWYGETRVAAGTAQSMRENGGTWAIDLPVAENMLLPVRIEMAKTQAEKDALMYGDGIRVINRTTMSLVPGVARHEAGHLLGLADQYPVRTAPNGINMDQKYSLYQFEGAVNRQSVMYNTDGPADVQCDDIEGFINAVDFVLRADGKQSPRLANGWADLCGRNYVYINGLPVRDKDAATAKQNRDAFARWAANGYPEAKKPAFASAALDTQQKARQDLKDFFSTVDSWEDRKRDLEVKAANLQFELDNAKFYGMSAAQKKKKQQELAGVQKELKRVNAGFNLLQEKKNNVRNGGNVAPDMSALQDELSRLAPGAAAAVSVADVKKPPVGKKKSNGPLPEPVRPAASVPQVRADAVPATAVAPASAASASASAALLKAEQKKELDSFLAQNNVSLKKALQKKNIGATLSPQEVALLARYGALYQNYAQKAPSAARQAKEEAAAPAPAAPAKVYCSVCGKEIADPSDAYRASSSRAVHKHSRCAYQYFSRRYSVDAKSLEEYEAFHFFGAPAGVTAAKGLMKDLGLTPADIRNYANISREEAAKQREELAKAKKEREEKARAEKETPALYQTVTEADVRQFIRANSATLNTLRRKQKAGEALNKKERLVWQNYRQLMNNRKLTQTYQNK